MTSQFSRQNQFTNINQDLIAFKKVLKWAQNIRERLSKNIGQIDPSELDEKYKNKFIKLNDFYESNFNVLSNFESKSKQNINDTVIREVINPNKPAEIQKTQNSNLIRNTSKERILITKLDYLTCKPKKKIAPYLCREPKIEKEISLENVSYDISLFEKFKSEMKKEMTSQNMRIEELEEKSIFITEFKIPVFEFNFEKRLLVYGTIIESFIL
ncbi:unnamed protein product [Brachionus calyciflorus]|uniref:Uncharacterized protein n=1 Tax=Brachionus calyciflorus TaxID=104777 RepID=A0A813M2F4_9BILA|nr:unnamed protein product [Brachionus calyciflorus]